VGPVDKVLMRNTLVKNIFKSNGGQAVIEYLLLTIIIVVIALTVIKQISESTESFAKNYFGEYLACLLEVGELPSLGGPEGWSEGCKDYFQPFTLANGWPPKNPDGNDGSNPGDDTGDDGSSGAISENADGDSSSVAGNSGGGDSDSGGGGLSGGSFNGRPSRVPLSGADKGKSSKSANNDLGNGGLNNFAEDEEFGDDGSGRSEIVPIYGQNLDEKEKEKDEKSVKTSVEQNPEQALRGRRVPASPEKQKDVDIEPDEGLTLPNFIKYLIIAAILLVIIIFLGGQVMQFQKSKD